RSRISASCSGRRFSDRVEERLRLLLFMEVPCACAPHEDVPRAEAPLSGQREVPGPGVNGEQRPGPYSQRHARYAPAVDQSSASAVSSCGALDTPSTTFTFSSTSAIIAGLSRRKSFAFSRPWPIFCPP